MSHSIETRVPFLDNDLVDFALRMPMSLKIKKTEAPLIINENEPGAKTYKYFNKTRDGKLGLRKVISKYVPDEIVKSEKQGFSAPDASWFKGESIEYVKGRLLKKDARIYEYMDYKEVSDLLKEHFDGKENRRLLIWSLLNFEQWLNTFL